MRYLTYQRGLSKMKIENAKHKIMYWQKLGKAGIMVCRSERLPNDESIIFIKGTGRLDQCSDVISDCLGTHTILYFEECSQYLQAEAYVREYKDIIGYKIDYKNCNGVYKMKDDFIEERLQKIIELALDDCHWTSHVYEFEKTNLLK